jgi:tetratricopeptide (TPR) repeat protein
MLQQRLRSLRSEEAAMKKPTTEQEMSALHNLRRSDPQRYIQIADDWIGNDPSDADTYFGRHIAWRNLGELDRALDDINTSIKPEPDPISYISRAQVYRQMGQHQKAIEDYEGVRATHPILWQEDWLSLLYQADSYACIGNEPAALACWGLLPDDMWTPGPHGAPAGNKSQIADELSRIAAAARRGTA